MSEPLALPDDQQDFWLGDLAGFQVQATDDGMLFLSHRCGWEQKIRSADSYLANIVMAAIEERKRHDCRPRTGY